MGIIGSRSLVLNPSCSKVFDNLRLHSAFGLGEDWNTIAWQYCVICRCCTQPSGWVRIGTSVDIRDVIVPTLHSAFGLGEDWNNNNRSIQYCQWLLHSAFGLGEDWNSIHPLPQSSEALLHSAFGLGEDWNLL